MIRREPTWILHETSQDEVLPFHATEMGSTPGVVPVRSFLLTPVFGVEASHMKRKRLTLQKKLGLRRGIDFFDVQHGFEEGFVSGSDTIYLL